MLEYENLRCDILELIEHIKHIGSDSSYILSQEEKEEILACLSNMEECQRAFDYYLKSK